MTDMIVLEAKELAEKHGGQFGENASYITELAGLYLPGVSEHNDKFLLSSTNLIEFAFLAYVFIRNLEK